MMTRITAKRLFNREAPLYARTQLKDGDRVFEAGDLIPWAELGWPEAAVLSMFRLRQVGHEPPEAFTPPTRVDVEVPDAPVAPVEAPETEAPPTEAPAPETAAEEPATPAPERKKRR